MVITQTSDAPDLAWTVSALGPGKGGRVVFSTTLTDTPAEGGIINTAGITATGDIIANNNRASVVSSSPVYLPVLQKQGG